MEFTPERSVYLNGEISTNNVLEIIAEISKLHSADPEAAITLFIVSGGGSINDSFAVYDFVNFLKPKLQTVALGEVNSSAVVLFMMGETRYIGRLTLMKFHRFSFSNIAKLTSKNSGELSDELKMSEARYVDILVERSGGKISKGMANIFLDKHAVITATQAIELGLAHKIL